jgi:hypothetical protein
MNKRFDAGLRYAIVLWIAFCYVVVALYACGKDSGPGGPVPAPSLVPPLTETFTPVPSATPTKTPKPEKTKKDKDDFELEEEPDQESV